MILRNATVVILDDPVTNTKAMLAFNKDIALMLSASLDNPEAAKQIALSDLRTYFTGPAVAIDPVLSRTIISELDKLKGD